MLASSWNGNTSDSDKSSSSVDVGAIADRRFGYDPNRCIGSNGDYLLEREFDFSVGIREFCLLGREPDRCFVNNPFSILSGFPGVINARPSSC